MGRFCPGVSDHRRRPSYPSDLTDGQWERVRPLVDRADPGRSSCDSDLRAVLDAVNYRWRTGCSWRMLPHDLPPWKTVYGHFRRWRRGGVLGEIRSRLIARERSDLKSIELHRRPPPQSVILGPTQPIGTLAQRSYDL